MSSKARTRFLNQIAVHDIDIELMDILKIHARKSINRQRLFNSSNAQQHPKASAIPRHGKEFGRRINHLKSTLYDSMIKIYYETTILYLREMLTLSIRNGLDFSRITGTDNIEFSSKDIISAGNWNNIVQMVSQTIFRRLENKRDSLLLLNELNKRLCLSISQTNINKVMPYLEMRHLIVHEPISKRLALFC